MRLTMYEPTGDEWPSHGVDVERERLLKGIDALMQIDESEQFRSPGTPANDLQRIESFLLLVVVQLAWYPVVIAYPIDLSTIRERISNGYYRRSNALKWDVKKMEENAKNFNEKGSQIIDKVKVVTKLLLKYIE